MVKSSSEYKQMCQTESISMLRSVCWVKKCSLIRTGGGLRSVCMWTWGTSTTKLHVIECARARGTSDYINDLRRCLTTFTMHARACGVTSASTTSGAHGFINTCSYQNSAIEFRYCRSPTLSVGAERCCSRYKSSPSGA